MPPEPTAAAGVGTVKGTVRLRGDAPIMKTVDVSSDPYCAASLITEPYIRVAGDGGLADVLVRLPVGAAPAAEPPRQPLVVNQQGCAYLPYVSGVISGRTLAIQNSDRTAHNVSARSGDEPVLNRAQPEGQPPVERAADQPPGAVYTLACDIHPWMRAYVVVSDHPYFTVTGADGSFELRDVPAGTYDLEIWHPHLGTQTTRVEVQDEAVVSADLTLDAAAFERP